MKYIFILLFVLACTSCSNVTNQDKAVASKEYTTPEDLIKYWIFDRNPDDAPFDESHFRKNHRTEIESTLKVNRHSVQTLYRFLFIYSRFRHSAKLHHLNLFRWKITPYISYLYSDV